MRRTLSNATCSGCGAKLAPDLRYCVSCYRPVANTSKLRLHSSSAQEIATTRRADPTLVFLPEEHEALLRRQVHRKRLILIGAIALVLLSAGLSVWVATSREQQKNRQALAREQMARRELGLLADALERFRSDVGRYPTDEEGIASLTRKPASIKPDEISRLTSWSGPYTDGIYEVDPWGSDYVYLATDGGQDFELFSYGPEGESGGRIHIRVTASKQ